MTRLAALGVCVALLAPAGAAQTLRYEGGAGAATGKYFFAERTTSFSLSTGFALDIGRLKLRASLPVWLPNTSLVTTTVAGSIPTGGPYGQGAVRDSGEARRRRQSGNGQGPGSGQGRAPGSPLPSLQVVPVSDSAVTGYQAAVGDLFLSTSARLLTGSRVSLTAGVSAKAPIADTATIGTGRWDAGVSLSVSVLAGRRLLIGADVSYWHLGDLPDLPFDDPVTGMVSLGASLGSGWGAIASLAGGSSALPGFDPPVTVGGAISHLGARTGWGVHAALGLTETAPDVSVGLTWTVRLTH